MRAERRRGQKTIYGQRRTRQRVRARCARSPVTPFRNTIFAELPPRADWAGACAERFGGLRLTSSAVSLPLAPSATAGNTRFGGGVTYPTNLPKCITGDFFPVQFPAQIVGVKKFPLAQKMHPEHNIDYKYLHQ